MSRRPLRHRFDADHGVRASRMAPGGRRLSESEIREWLPMIGDVGEEPLIPPGIPPTSQGYARWDYAPALWPTALSTLHNFHQVNGFASIDYKGAFVAPGDPGVSVNVGEAGWGYSARWSSVTTPALQWYFFNFGTRDAIWNMTNGPVLWKSNLGDITLPVSTNPGVPSAFIGGFPNGAYQGTFGSPDGTPRAGTMKVAAFYAVNLERGWFWSADPSPASYTEPPTDEDNAYPKDRPFVGWDDQMVGVTPTTGWKLQFTRVSSEAGLSTVYILFQYRGETGGRPYLGEPGGPGLSDEQMDPVSTGYSLTVPVSEMPLGVSAQIPVAAGAIAKFADGTLGSVMFYGVADGVRCPVTLTDFAFIPPA